MHAVLVGADLEGEEMTVAKTVLLLGVPITSICEDGTGSEPDLPPAVLRKTGPKFYAQLGEGREMV